MSEVLYTETRTSQLGRFAELGGFLELYGDWVPGSTPDEAAATLMTIAGYLANTRIPLEMAQGIAIEDTQDRFDTETSPDGEPWVQVSDSYRRYKVEVEGYPDGILVRDEFLQDVAASESAWKIIGSTLVFDPYVLPKDDGFNYGMLHQQGGSAGRESILGAEFTFVKGKGFEQTGEKSIRGLPARPFIGLSDAAVAKIAAAFSAWFEEMPFEGGGGGIGIPTGENVLGEFPIVGYTKRGQPMLRTPGGIRFGRML